MHASITSPLLLKPRISKLMLDVRPVWISCRCLKRLSRALPRPLSSSPCVRTPNRVDFPESTFPSTATRRSKNCLRPWPHVAWWGEGIEWSACGSTFIRLDRHVPGERESHLLVIRNFSNEDFCNFPSVSVKVVVHLSLSEQSDVSPDSDDTRQTNSDVKTNNNNLCFQNYVKRIVGQTTWRCLQPSDKHVRVHLLLRHPL